VRLAACRDLGGDLAEADVVARQQNDTRTFRGERPSGRGTDALDASVMTASVFSILILHPRFPSQPFGAARE
jgi:hypothetical protein